MASTNGASLRFAALIRVSTERQEKQGESLRTQHSQIEQAVARMGGTVTRWLEGQEHATPGWEREQRDSMLDESERPNRSFDAVMVAHQDRWSRDDTRSSVDLDRLHAAGVRFFVLGCENNLADPTARLCLGMSAVFGRYQAHNQTKKAFESRIERAKRGIPTCGKMPFARIYNKQTGQWEVDVQKQAMIHDIAERYLAGESLWKLATEHGQNHPNITRCLRDRCGSTYKMRFHKAELAIDETITIKVPPLLPEDIIRAVCQRMDAKRTYMHGAPKNKYLLGGLVFCAVCGLNLTGADGRNALYYRHNRKYCHCHLDPLPWVRADKLEEAVVKDLFELLGNPAACERAVKAATPNVEKTRKQQDRLQAELAKIEKARDRVLSLVEKDLINQQEAEERLQRYKQQKGDAQSKLSAMGDLPSAKECERLFLEAFPECGVIRVVDKDGNAYAGGNDIASYVAMMQSDRRESDLRELVRRAFNGKLPDGKPAGVYVKPAGGKRHGPKQFTYELRGRLLVGANRLLEGASGRFRLREAAKRGVLLSCP